MWLGLGQKIAICVLLAVPVSSVVVASRRFSGVGGEQVEVAIVLAVASVVIGGALRLTSFWRIDDPKVLRLSLVGASLVAATSVMLEPVIQASVAGAQGTFDRPAAWSTVAQESADAQVFDHPVGGYSMTLDARWQAQAERGGQVSFELRRQGALAAELHPSCWHGRRLAEVVAEAHREEGAGAWSCGRQGRFKACRHQAADDRVDFWLEREEGGSGALLMYRVHEPLEEAVLVEGAATLAFSDDVALTGCSVPMRWATF